MGNFLRLFYKIWGMDNNQIRVRSHNIEGAEVSWFAPICNGDFEYLGIPDDRFKSSWENASRIVERADELGYRNILCPSSYQVGQDTLPFVAAMAPKTTNINMLAAVRCGEIHPPMLARTLTTIDHILKGRLTVNIISSDLPGQKWESDARYRRSGEVIQILKQAWNNERISFDGEFYKQDLPTDPVKPYQQNGGPLLYFGGYSPQGLDLCARYCDVYLMWPDKFESIRAQMENMSNLSAKYNRVIDFGLRVHVIVRESESEAREWADRLVSKLEKEVGEDFRNRAQDAKSLGVAKQSGLRSESDEYGYVEDNLWTGIGRARSGCGAAIVGDPDQVYRKLKAYMDLGIRSFILSGYPHFEECGLFAKYVLPKLKTVSLPEVQGRRPLSTPNTPLAGGKRK